VALETRQEKVGSVAGSDGSSAGQQSDRVEVHVGNLVDNRCLYRRNDSVVGEITQKWECTVFGSRITRKRRTGFNESMSNDEKECMDRLSLKKRKKEEVSERDTWGLSAQNHAWH
jgi:hypothetical protein